MWYAFTMDDGNIAKAPTNKELLYELSGTFEQRCKRRRKGIYFLEVKDDDDVWAERAYIYGSKKLALLDGWSFENTLLTTKTM